MSITLCLALALVQGEAPVPSAEDEFDSAWTEVVSERTSDSPGSRRAEVGLRPVITLTR